MPFGPFGKRTKNEVDSKARLERKLCLAKESYEPIFDISECNLKTVPSGVYALCKVFRKEALYLNDNLLNNLSGGGVLQDLHLLRILDLHSNKLTKLPDELKFLVSLEILNVSSNNLSSIPECIGILKHLTNLNASTNQLRTLPQSIGDCFSLRVVDVRNNSPLKRLPSSMGRLSSLTEVHVSETLEFPLQEDFAKGISTVKAALRAGTAESTTEDPESNICNTENAMPNIGLMADASQYDALQEKLRLLEISKEERRLERLNLEQNLTNATQMELLVQEAVRANKNKLVEDLLSQQRTLEAEISKVQAHRDEEKAMLLQQCCHAEERAYDMVDQLINNSKSWKERVRWLTEQTLLEDQLLENITNTSKSLEKAAVLQSMEELMKEELRKAQHLQESEQHRIQATQSLISQESIMSEKLATLAKKSGDEQKELLDSIRKNEDLQKTAVASLLEKSDTRSWELTQQVAVVESKLAELSRLEMQRRKLETDGMIVELSCSRVALTQLLLELFEEQAQRRAQLVASLQRMEGQRAAAADGYWLEQYNRLLNSQSHSLVETLRTVDPDLSSELIVAGVLHYLPLLAPLLASTKLVHNLSEEQLAEAGIENPDDRRIILKVVSAHLSIKDAWCGASPSAPEDTEASAPVLSPSSSYDASQIHRVSDDCVVCLDALCDVIFIPCGHVCCCFKCGGPLQQCPLCRGAVAQVVRAAAPQ